MNYQRPGDRKQMEKASRSGLFEYPKVDGVRLRCAAAIAFYLYEHHVLSIRHYRFGSNRLYVAAKKRRYGSIWGNAGKLLRLCILPKVRMNGVDLACGSDRQARQDVFEPLAKRNFICFA